MGEEYMDGSSGGPAAGFMSNDSAASGHGAGKGVLEIPR